MTSDNQIIVYFLAYAPPVEYPLNRSRSLSSPDIAGVHEPRSTPFVPRNVDRAVGRLSSLVTPDYGVDLPKREPPRGPPRAPLPPPVLTGTGRPTSPSKGPLPLAGVRVPCLGSCGHDPRAWT